MKPTLLILAAGMGSRYGGLKQIDSMGPSGEVIMDYSIFDAVRANFGKIVFVIRHDFEEEFRVKVGNKYAHMLPVEYAFQDLNDIPAGFSVPEGREKPWGTSHAILSARNVIKEPFAMVNADDFYGAESYEIVGKYLAATDPASNEWCMSGYKLCNVLSEYGGVTRAICRTDESGYLTRIEEMFKIQKDGDHAKGCTRAEEWRELGLQDLTSMNFFGFTPGIFKLLEEGFVTFLEKEGGRLFVNAPNALDGNRADKNDTSRAQFQAQNAGTVDLAGSEEEIFAQIRHLVALLPQDNDDMNLTDCTDDLNRISEDLAACAGDTSIALSMIADGQDFFETKAEFAPEMVTGFLRLNGSTVGAVANRSQIADAEGKTRDLGTRLTPQGCRKAVDFIRFCDAFDIPVLSLTNVTGFQATVDAEKEMALAAAKLTAAFAGATVPKVNVIVGQAMGSAANVMNSKATGADFTICWNGARFGVMDGKLAAEILCDGADADALAAKAAEIEAMNNNAVSAAQRGYVDQIIDPAETRKYVVAAFEMLFSKAIPVSIKKHMTV